MSEYFPVLPYLRELCLALSFNVMRSMKSLLCMAEDGDIESVRATLNYFALVSAPYNCSSVVFCMLHVIICVGNVDV